MKMRLGLLLLFASLAGCSPDAIRPEPGLGWSYSSKPIDADTFHIIAKESRFASTGQAEELFRVAAKRVAEAEHCRSYRVVNQARFITAAAMGAGLPVIEGDLVCER